MKYSIINRTMETKSNKETEKKKRNSILVFVFIVLLAMASFFPIWKKQAENGTMVVVTVDGTERLRASLFINQELAIDSTNTLVVKNGYADMVYGECPDQICVKHSPISKVGETIICLPNKVVVTIEGWNGTQKQKEGEPDAMVK